MQVYKCNIFGNMVEVLHAGQGELVCCGQPMVHQTEIQLRATRDKHVPVIDLMGESVKVTIGSALHPM